MKLPSKMMPKIFFSSKAVMSGSKIVFYIIFAIVAALTFLLIVYMVSTDKSKIAVIRPGLEDYLLIQRFLLSSNCFVYQDDSGRVHPWTIDLEKFNENNLNKCYFAENTNVKAFRLTLSYGTFKSTLSTKNWEGFIKMAETKKVYVYDNGQIKQGELFIEVQDVK